MKKALLVIFSVLFLDQVIKIWIKTTFHYDESVMLIPGFFRLFFIENNGMAFGMEFGGVSGKLFLSIFRIAAVAAIGYYLYTITRKKTDPLLIVCVSLIFAGAFGNIIDSMFYGIIFGPSYYNEPAMLFPPGGGYASFLQGKVVDMFQFIVKWPSWVPGLGGKPVFSAIFNLADASISIGVILLIIFNKRIFGRQNVSEGTVTQP